MTNREAAEIMKAIIFILKNDDYSDEVEEAIHMAINALTAQPEIIRCKDCRYKERKGVDYFCDHITGEEIMVSPNDHCSWAEMETDRG